MTSEYRSRLLGILSCQQGAGMKYRKTAISDVANSNVRRLNCRDRLTQGTAAITAVAITVSGNGNASHAYAYGGSADALKFSLPHL